MRANRSLTGHVILIPQEMVDLPLEDIIMYVEHTVGRGMRRENVEVHNNAIALIELLL